MWNYIGAVAPKRKKDNFEYYLKRITYSPKNKKIKDFGETGQLLVVIFTILWEDFRKFE